MLQRLRNSQVIIFSSFVLFLLFWITYISIGIYRTGIPSWDYASPAPDSTFVFPLARLAGLFAILLALLCGCAFLATMLKQIFARDRQNILPLSTSVPNILVSILLISFFLIPSIFDRFSQVAVPVLVISSGICLLFSVMSNVLRLRQGLRNATLTWRFMRSTLIPALVTLAILGTFYLTLFWDNLGLLALTILAIVMAISLVFTMMSNVLRLRQGIRNATLTWRFMRSTFTPALVILALLGILYLLLFWLPISVLTRFELLIPFALTLVVIMGILFGVVIYLGRQIQHFTFSPLFLRSTFGLASLTTLAMLVILGLLLFQIQAIDLHANSLGLHLKVLLLLHVIVFCMAIPTLFSCISLWRGFRA